MNDTSETLPHWDLTPLYPSLDSAAFQADFAAHLQAIGDLVALFDAQGIDRTDQAQVPTAVFEQTIHAYNQLMEQYITLQAYLQAYLTTDSHNDLAQTFYSDLQEAAAQINQLGTRLTAWAGSVDVESLIARVPLAQEHAYFLRRAQTDARHMMSPEQEALAAELNVTGGSSWYHMYTTTTSQLTVTMELDGRSQTLPLTAVQNLAYHPNRDTRRRAYEAITETLQATAVPLAAALNSIKGETLTLAKRRGWETPLQATLHDNAIDAATLEAMLSATRTAFPAFRRYLHARAKHLGLARLAWYDRVVPLGESSTPWSYSQATQFIEQQFATYSPKLAQLAGRAFRENWIDAPAREGKSGGAFCMWLRHGESRILTNYQNSFSEVSTLAHELGHAYHNLNLNGRTPLQRGMPMTLAETASTFCQKIVENAALKTASPRDQRIILDGLLEYATRVVLGVMSDFQCEQTIFQRRSQRALTVAEFCAIAEAAQQETYGDAVENHFPHRWAIVPHYYVLSYYNYPYTFGLLFGLGLYARYQTDPEAFKANYDDLLSRTGMSEASDLAAAFGINTRDPEFWLASLQLLQDDIARFEALTIA